MRTRGLILILVLWLGAAGAGTWVLMNYENTPSLSGSTPAQWPSGSRIAREPGHSTLVMFLHPRCPCSRASVNELNQLIAHCGGLVSTHVLFVRPKGMTDDWTETSLRKNAESIPNVQVAIDRDGEEAQRFGAESSGAVLLYDEQGKLLFSGGITAGRGHEGDNAGKTSVIALAHGYAASVKHTEVFGCTLLDHCDSNTNATSP